MGFLRLRYPGRLAQQFAAYIVLFSSVLALGITVAELSIEYQRDLRNIDAQMEQIEDAYLPSVVENVWVVDHERLATLLLGITRLPNFALAEIRVDGSALVSRGEAVGGAGVQRVFPLHRLHRGQQLLIGELVVAASYQEVYRRTIDRLLFFFGANVLKTFFVVLFVFSLFYRLIGRHLVRVARHSGQVAEDQRVGPLTLERTEPRQGDEFSELVTALNQMRQRLGQQQTALQQQVNDLRTKDAAMASSLNAIAIADLNGKLSYVNQAFVDLWQLPQASDACGRSVLGFWQQPERAQAVVEALRQQGRWQGELRAQRSDGSVADVQMAANLVLNDYGQPFCMMSSFIDISQRKQDEAELRIAAVAFESQQGMIVTNAERQVLRVNRAFTEITGYTAAEAMGRQPSFLKSGLHEKAFYDAMWQSIHRTGAWQGEIWDLHKNSELLPIWLAISAVQGTDGVVTHFIGTQSDMREYKKAKQKINDLAYYDQLTGLPNRTLLLERIRHAMVAGSRAGNYAALLFIDLDQFKTLNESLGHETGNLLLQHVARQLEQGVRQGDTSARLGGDEFVTVLEGLSATEAEAAAAVEKVAQKILDLLNQPCTLGAFVHHGSASIGVVLFSTDKVNPDELLKQAELAMYKSKEAGRNAWSFFDPRMESAARERAALERDLRQALAGRQFLLYYQPQVYGRHHLTGAEALIRWQHPVRGMVSPADFIPLAEATGLILPIGQWVLEQACAQLARWAGDTRLAALTVAVNVSAKQFRQADFVAQVLATLERSGARPQQLKLELTESLLVQDVSEVIEKMTALKQRGVGFSLDDFGTGYSSLSYLKRLPLDQLKIDQSFVRDLLVDSDDASIAETVVALSRSLNLSVIAEGVETEAQRAFLALLGCHHCQGYLFARPLPAAEFERFGQSHAEALAE